MKRFVIVMLVLGLSFSAQIARAEWSAVKKLTWTPGESKYPAIAIDSSKTIHVVWYDTTTGNFDIYYRNGK